jgi:hypothetical protein
VSDAIPYKSPVVVDLSYPLEVEDGWLIDGHHRTGQAVRDRVTSLAVKHVSSVLVQQREYHASLVERVRQVTLQR